MRLELAAIEAGLSPEMRKQTPLFGPRLGVEWHHSLISRVLVFLLTRACRLSAEEAKGYSWHSFRIYLATALYAAKCPNDRIQAILRWKSEEALLIYARLNDSERDEWISKAAAVQIDSTVSAYLPTIDGAVVAAHLLDDELRVPEDDDDE